MIERDIFDPTLFSQTCNCAPLYNDDGVIVAYRFKASKTRRKQAGSLKAAVEPDEDSFLDCIRPYEYGLTFSLTKKYSGECSDVRTLFGKIGFVWTAVDETMQVPTIARAQENLDRLAMPIQLVPTGGIASDKEFLSIFTRDGQKVSLAVSTGQEFLHDMMIHVCNVVKYICTHQLDDSTGLPSDIFGKKTDCAMHGSYFAALMHGRKQFEKAVTLVQSLHSPEHKSVLLTYLASLCDLYTASDTSQSEIKAEVHCLMTGMYCTCFHSTGVNSRPYFNAAYCQDNFAALLVEGTALLRQKMRSTL